MIAKITFRLDITIYKTVKILKIWITPIIILIVQEIYQWMKANNLKTDTYLTQIKIWMFIMKLRD